MRPLPRLHAITDDDVLADADLGIHAAAIAAVGPAAALHVRGRQSSAAFLARCATRFMALASPAEAAVIVNGRPDLARAVGAQGVQLGTGDLACRTRGRCWARGGSAGQCTAWRRHSEAISDGADFLLLGSVFETTTHPGQPALGLDLLADVAALGTPVVAIGGVTPARAQAVRDAGAWGVAAIRSLWHAPDSYAAAMELLTPWSNEPTTEAPRPA